jgi:hypothetical protein
VIKPDQAEGKFAPEPFIIKTPAPGDFDTLRRYLRSPDKAVAHSAGVILGYYYIRAEDYWNAELLLRRYYSETILPAYIQKLGELWQMDFALDKQEFTIAERWAARAKSGLDNKERQRALETYCLINKLQAVDGDPYSCVTERIESAKTDAEKRTERFTGGGDYIYKRGGGALNILVISSASMADASSGVYFYAKRNPEFEHKLRLSKVPREGDWDFVIDIDHNYLGLRGYGLFFSANLSEYLSNFTEYVDLPCGRLLIGTNRGLREAAQTLVQKITEVNAGAEVVAMDIRDNALIRDTLVKWEDAAFCAIGAGNEDEMTNFIPKVRQYVLRSDQRVYVLEDTFTGRQLEENYRGYFYSTRFFPIFDLYFSDEVSIFADEYREFSGRELTYDALLGYEMMHVIHSQALGIETGENYLTGIVGFYDSKARRQLKGYFVNSRGTVDTLNVRLPPIIEEESGIGGEQP